MRVIRETIEEEARRVAKSVSVIAEASGRLMYCVPPNNHNVTMDLTNKTRKGWGCTCHHGSLYGINKSEELCKHIKAVRHAIQLRGNLRWTK